MSLKIKKISEKQRLVLNWWCDNSKYSKMDAIICDGAVRSGKTLFMGLSFVIWSMATFSGKKFGMCGKTIGSMRRNVTSVILPILRDLGFTYKEKLSQNVITVYSGNKAMEKYSALGRKYMRFCQLYHLNCGELTAHPVTALRSLFPATTQKL